MAKLIGVFQSRKFWAAIVALLVSFGLLQVSEAQEPELVQAILTVVTTIAYIIGTAIEDAGRAQGGQRLD